MKTAFQMIKSLHILLLRHGQTDANAAGRLQGHQLTPLNRLGIQQANLLAGRLAGFSPALELVISSDLPRATETAAPIATACGLPVKTDAAWRERSFGLLEGKPVGDKKKLWDIATGELDIPGAEPASEMCERVRLALLAVPQNYPNHRAIAVVTHGGPLRTILKMLADGRLITTRGEPVPPVPVIPNCAILHLVARRYPEEFRWKIEAVNDVSHLC
jgi:broad specificity phosphatase PhoE